MAMPIAPTPTLRGDEARRFVEEIKNPKHFIPKDELNIKGIENAAKELLARAKKCN